MLFKNDKLFLVIYLWILICGCTEPPTTVCSHGTEGCACQSGDVCDDGLMCVAGKCRSETDLPDRPQGARACEEVFFDPDGAIEKVEFVDKVVGGFLRRGPQVALGFALQRDEELGMDAYSLKYVEGASKSNVALKTRRCFDRLGKPIEK